MFGFGQLIGILKKSPKKIVFTEGEDSRILEASSRLLASNFLHPILIGNEEKIMNAAEESGFNIRGAEIIDPMEYEDIDEMAECLYELRKNKGMTLEKAKATCQQANYFGTMLVKMGKADALLAMALLEQEGLGSVACDGGFEQVDDGLLHGLGVRESATGGNTVLAMGDCAINIKPNEDELAEIAIDCAECAKIFGIDPKIAFLSYSTYGSGAGEDVDKMRNAAQKAKDLAPDLLIAGEMQFDAAVSPRVARTKCPGDPVAGSANTFIFPDINAGNIGYKIAQRLGGFDAYGPIMLGLNAPINDLSRGCNASEVYSMAIVTAALA